MVIFIVDGYVDMVRQGLTSDEKVLYINYVDFIEVVVFVAIIREEWVCEDWIVIWIGIIAHYKILGWFIVHLDIQPWYLKFRKYFKGEMI